MASRKSQIFKQFLKEAIREVIKEELPRILREELKSNKPMVESHQDFVRDFSPNYKQFLPKDKTYPSPQPQPSFQNNPINKILAQTKMSMTGDDYRSLQMNTEMEQIMSSPAMVHNGMIAQNMNMNIGEVEEWQPTSMNLPQFPM